MAKSSAKGPASNKRSAKAKASATKKKSVASASAKSVRQKERGPMNNAVVKNYAAEIKPLLGDKDFDNLLARIKDDPEVGQAEAVGLASDILEAPVAPSTSRTAALARILKLHNSLTTFKLKQRAVGGRSAA